MLLPVDVICYDLLIVSFVKGYMIFYRYPDWSAEIRHHYWILRSVRGFDSARLRKQYRLIEREKKRLYDAGVDKEVVRLLCRHMVNPRNAFAEKRFWSALHEIAQESLPFSG